MPRLSPQARLAPSLLSPRGWLAAETLCLAREPHLLGFDEAPRAEPQSPLAPLFCTKRIDASSVAISYPMHAPPPPAHAYRFSLRLTAARRARMKTAAKRLRQSCQAFLTDALEAHLERIAQDVGLPSAL
ncbi:MAG: hypothetical protein ACREFQ_00480 [Stellaceae bacterium]